MARGKNKGEGALTVDDSSADGEEQELGRHGEVEGFREILRVGHVSDERGDQRLADEGVGNIEEGGRSLDKRGSSGSPDSPAERGEGALSGGVSGGDVAVGCSLDSVADDDNHEAARL